MSGGGFILRLIFGTIFAIVLGVTLVFGFTVVEPFHAEFGDAGSEVGWSPPNVMRFGVFAGLGLFGVLIAWVVFASIRNDVRQQTGR